MLTGQEARQTQRSSAGRSDSDVPTSRAVIFILFCQFYSQNYIEKLHTVCLKLYKPKL